MDIRFSHFFAFAISICINTYCSNFKSSHQSHPSYTYSNVSIAISHAKSVYYGT